MGVAGPTLAWWTLLCAVAAVNLCAWALSALLLRRRHGGTEGWHLQRWQLLLSAGYVAGCAWRSAVPVFDVPRLVMIDSVASSVVVGRSVATVAELCFAAQWALLLAVAGRQAGSVAARRVAGALVPMILLAELFSWHAVLTTSNLGHVVEETLWGSAALLLVWQWWSLRPALPAPLRRFAVAVVVAGAGYAAYMFMVDVPMYLARWLADEAAGRPYFDLWQGLHDAASRWTVSHDWTHWKTEVVWMTLYFSVAVWCSIGLAHVPAWQRDPQARQVRPVS